MGLWLVGRLMPLTFRSEVHFPNATAVSFSSCCFGLFGAILDQFPNSIKDPGSSVVEKKLVSFWDKFVFFFGLNVPNIFSV